MKKIVRAAIGAACGTAASAAGATQAWIGHKALNARSSPGVQYHKLGVFNPCTPVHIVNYTKDHYGNPTWYKVAFKHSYYWVKADYVQGHACHWAPKKVWKPKKKHHSHKHWNGYSY